MGTACRFFFRADGSEDRLTATVTLRNGFAQPIPACSVSVDLTATPLTRALCSCDPLRIFAVTDAAGAAQYVFSRIGGRGELGVEVTVHCAGKIALWSERHDFTSPDLDGSCDAGISTDVFDLAAWAAGLPPGAAPESDYNCDGQVNVFDLGAFAGGLGMGCGP
jgi:hypothetical protein